jgi:hypothetical protein
MLLGLVAKPDPIALVLSAEPVGSASQLDPTLLGPADAIGPCCQQDPIALGPKNTFKNFENFYFFLTSN